MKLTRVNGRSVGPDRNVVLVPLEANLEVMVLCSAEDGGVSERVRSTSVDSRERFTSVEFEEVVEQKIALVLGETVDRLGEAARGERRAPRSARCVLSPQLAREKLTQG